MNKKTRPAVKRALFFIGAEMFAMGDGSIVSDSKDSLRDPA